MGARDHSPCLRVMASQKRNVRRVDTRIGHECMTSFVTVRPGPDSPTHRSLRHALRGRSTGITRYPAALAALGLSTVVHAEHVLWPVSREVPSPMTGLTQYRIRTPRNPAEGIISRARPTTRIRVGPAAASQRCTVSVSGQSAIHRYVPLTTLPTCGVPLIATAAATGLIRASTSRGGGGATSESDAPALSSSCVAPDTAAVDALYSLHPASKTITKVLPRFARVTMARRPMARLMRRQWDEEVESVSACVVVINAKPFASPRDTSTLRVVLRPAEI